MKNIFKRLCCLVIAFVMCTGTFVFAAEAESQSAVNKNMSKAMYFLREMGIIGDYFDYNTDVAEKITRAEFADIVVKALDLKVGGRTDTYFYDVPLTHFACDQINALAERGFIHGVGDNCFAPDDYIYASSACKIILSILGYERLAAVSSENGQGYIKMAADLDLIKIVAADSILTRGDMFTMIFEALQTPVYSINGVKGNAAVYDVDEEETLLKVYRQAMFGKGIVDGARNSSFNGIELMGNEVDISGDIYTTRINLDDMLGEEIEFIAYMDEDWTDGEIAVAYKTGKTDIVNISGKQFVKFDKNEYKLYYSDGNNKRKSIKIERNVKLIYNGGFIEKDISDRLNEGCDLKILKGKDGYDKIVAKKKKNIIVKNADKDNYIVTNMADYPRSIDLMKDRESVVFKKSGEAEMTFDKIVYGDVLSIYESYYESPAECGSFVEVVVTSEKITGVIEDVYEDTEETWITVNGVKYFDLSGINCKIGENIEIYLDVDGDIAYAETIPINDFAAYLIEGKVIPDHDVYDEVLVIKMLKQDGKIEKLYCTEKLRIDSEKVKDAYEALSLLSDAKSGSFKPQLVLVKVDSEGLISHIDTVGGKTEEGTLRVSLSEDSYMYKGTGYLGNNSTDIVALSSSTVIFRIPTDAMIKNGEATESDYGVGNSGYIGDNDWVTATTYRTTESKTGVEEFLVAKLKGKASATPWPILVEKVISTYDENEGEVLNTIIGYDGYNQVKTPVFDEAKWTKMGSTWKDGNISAIKPGMVVSFVTDSKGVAKEVNLVYDPKNRTEYYKTGDYNGMMNEIGIAEDASDNILIMRVGVDGKSIAIKSDSADILVYDENGEIRKGSFMDAKLYVDSYNQNNPETYSDVVIFQWQRWPRRVYIFK